MSKRFEVVFHRQVISFHVDGKPRLAINTKTTTFSLFIKAVKSLCEEWQIEKSEAFEKVSEVLKHEFGL